MYTKVVIILLSIVPLLFFTGSYDPFLIKKGIAEIGIGLAVLFWLLNSPKRKFPGHLPKLIIPFGLFIVSIAFSLLHATHKPLVLEFLIWTIFLVLLYLVSCYIFEEDRISILKGIALASIVAGIYGILQSFGFDFVQWSSVWGGRPGSTFGNPNFSAGWWVLTFPLFLSQSLRSHGKECWLWSFSTLLVLVNLLLTKTRGAWLALGLALLIVLVVQWWMVTQSSHLKKRLIVGGALIVFLVVSIFGFNKIKHTQDPSILERVFKWATAVEIIKDFPVFGVGANNLKVSYALYQSQVRKSSFFRDKIPLRATSESNVHSEYLQIWAEMGTFGLGTFLLIFFSWAVFFSKKLLKKSTSENLPLLGIIAAVTGFLLYSLTNFPLRIVPSACLLFVLLGISESPSKKNIVPLKNFSGPLRSDLLLSLAMTLLFLAIFWKKTIPNLYADVLRQKGEIALANQNYSKAEKFFTKAIELDYHHSEKTAYFLGESLRFQGQFRKAIEAYEISTHLRNYGEVYNNIGNCYYELKQFKPALKNWEIAVHLGLPGEKALTRTEKNIQVIKKRIKEK